MAFPKTCSNKVVNLERTRMASTDAMLLKIVCCTSKAASQHAVALQQRFILVVKREKCYAQRATSGCRRGTFQQHNNDCPRPLDTEDALGGYQDV